MDIQWHEDDDETGERWFFRAERFASVWKFYRKPKRRGEWFDIDTPTRDHWETLLDAIERRIPRYEATEKDAVPIKKILQAWPKPKEVDPESDESEHS